MACVILAGDSHRIGWSKNLKTEKLVARMLNGEPFTYGELARQFAPGKTGAHDDSNRLVDRTIQKLRRKGLIGFKREGGKVIWKATKPQRSDDREGRKPDAEKRVA